LCCIAFCLLLCSALSIDVLTRGMMVLSVASWSCDAVCPSAVVVAVTVTLGSANSGCRRSVGRGAAQGVHADFWCVFCLVTGLYLCEQQGQWSVALGAAAAIASIPAVRGANASATQGCIFQVCLLEGVAVAHQEPLALRQHALMLCTNWSSLRW